MDPEVSSGTFEAQFWRGRRVLITGHTGFKGAWLCAWLLRLGAHVSGFALRPLTTPNLFDGLRLSYDMDSSFGDIRSRDTVNRALKASRPEVIFHLAAQPLVRASYETPVETFDTNVMGVVHLLDAARHTESVRAIVVVTTDKCYAHDPDDSRPFVESDRLGGHDPYSSSKACAELVTSSYRASYSPNSVPLIGSARAGNVIGGGDWSVNRIVPDIVAAIENGIPISLRFPHAIRPWQHVLDPLCGYLMLAQKLAVGNTAFAGAYNFGPDYENKVDVVTLAERFYRAYGQQWEYECDSAPQFHEAAALRLNSSKAREQLGWKSRFSVDEAIQRTATWYAGARSGAAMTALVDSDFKAFEAGLLATF